VPRRHPFLEGGVTLKKRDVAQNFLVERDSLVDRVLPLCSIGVVRGGMIAGKSVAKRSMTK